MITDETVFRDDYLPRRLQHRSGAVETLSRALDPAVHGSPANDILLAGPSGVGKTVLARHTLDRLNRHAAVPTAHVDCLGETPGSILRSILAQHPTATDPRHNLPADTAESMLRRAVDEPAVVVLDEGGALPDSDIVECLLSVSGLSVIAICHDADGWLASASTRVREHFTGDVVTLDRYGTDELADILATRARLGLLGGVWSREQLETIADEVAGVARDGIYALRAAAELASERDHSEIEAGDIADCFARARKWIREAALASLPLHHNLLYALVHAAGKIAVDELHDRYDRVAERVYEGAGLATPIGRRQRQNVLSKCVEYDLLDYRGEGRERVYWVADKGVGPRIEVPAVQ
jgi:Cdc6-like AAA superfamily ATPase